MPIKAGTKPRPKETIHVMEPMATTPLGCDLEIAVTDADGVHALVFPCHCLLDGWVNAETKERIDVHPTQWRQWGASRQHRVLAR